MLSIYILTVTEYLYHKWPQTCWICSVYRHHNLIISSLMTYHRPCNRSNMTGATCRAEIAYSPRVPEFTYGFSWVCVSRSSVLCNVL